MLRVCKPLVLCGLLILLFCSPVAGQQKAKVPDAEAQAKSLALVKQIFAEEYSGAKTALLKSALAKKMLGQAFDITKATSDKFVLLRVARDMAVMAGDHQTSIAAVVETARQFQVDEIRTTASVLAKLSKTVHSVEDNEAIATHMDALIVRAMKASEFDIATKLTPIALATARKARQIGLMARIKDRGEELAKLADVFVEVQKAEKVLEETPNDPAANLTVGRFRCFIQADWEQGLPMLAIGSDAALKKLAGQELNASKSREMFLVADGWVKVAEQETVTAKGEIRKHAAGWFFRVLPSLTGLDRARAEQTVLALSPWRLAPIPRVADKSVVSKRREIKGAKVLDLTLSPREMAGRPQWSDDGKYLFHMDKSGLLSKISVPEFQIVRQLEISKPCTSFGRSSLGLVAVLATSGQMWVIDEQTLFVKKKIDSIGAHRAACSPLIPLVYLTPENHNMVAIVDLVTGKPEALIQASAFSAARLGSFSSARLTPDGRYFLCASNGSIWRFGIGEKKFLFEQKGPAIASQSSAGINVGPASRYVAYTKGAGNWDRGYGTYVYDVKNLVQPKLKIESGNYPRSIGFDGVTGKVYAQNFDTQLIVFSATGQKETEYELTRRGDDTNDFIVHPAGSKLLVQCNQLIWVELP